MPPEAAIAVIDPCGVCGHEMDVHDERGCCDVTGCPHLTCGCWICASFPCQCDVPYDAARAAEDLREVS